MLSPAFFYSPASTPPRFGAKSPESGPKRKGRQTSERMTFIAEQIHQLKQTLLEAGTFQYHLFDSQRDIPLEPPANPSERVMIIRLAKRLGFRRHSPGRQVSAETIQIRRKLEELKNKLIALESFESHVLIPEDLDLSPGFLESAPNYRKFVHEAKKLGFKLKDLRSRAKGPDFREVPLGGAPDGDPDT
ncbi:MAG: hypothetical protein IPK79_12360 [Vampirovibrionales bacterium]|nr:hypothetical protein [Vampirovibrionales bacterium]